MALVELLTIKHTLTIWRSDIRLRVTMLPPLLTLREFNRIFNPVDTTLTFVPGTKIHVFMKDKLGGNIFDKKPVTFTRQWQTDLTMNIFEYHDPVVNKKRYFVFFNKLIGGYDGFVTA